MRTHPLAPIVSLGIFLLGSPPSLQGQAVAPGERVRVTTPGKFNPPRFGEIGNYLARYEPAALMLWGRHDIFFELDETLSWMKALPRMEAHILDGPHLLLETHPGECAALMSAFISQAESRAATKSLHS